MRTFLVALSLLVLSVDAGQAPAPAQNRPAPRWEYAVYYHGDVLALAGKSLHEKLNTLGDTGWELVAVAPGVTEGKDETAVKQTVYFFKRPKDR